MEGRAIQSHLKNSNTSKKKDSTLARSFEGLISRGKIKAALHLTAKHTGTPLQLDEVIDTGASGNRMVRDILVDKHPPGVPVSSDSISDLEPEPLHPVIFDALEASSIRSVALHMRVAVRPSGIGAQGWRRLCCSLASVSENQCHPWQQQQSIFERVWSTRKASQLSWRVD